MKYLILSSILLAIAIVSLSACSNKTPDNLGMTNGKFVPCPQRDNCVSSQSTNDKHAITPIVAHGHADVVMIDLANSIESMFGAKIITMNAHYIHAEFTSRIMRFVDDLECFYDEKAGLIQVRSASRVGYSDFNANRKRIEELRILFTKTQ